MKLEKGDDKMPDFEEKALCRKVGGVFELSAQIAVDKIKEEFRKERNQKNE